MDEDREIKTELARLIADMSSTPPEMITHLLQRDASFRQMCQEYAECREMVHRWRETLPTHLSRIDEYETLGREVESEIVRFLRRQRRAHAGDRRAGHNRGGNDTDQANPDA
jgi:hypothetical protein